MNQARFLEFGNPEEGMYLVVYNGEYKLAQWENDFNGESGFVETVGDKKILFNPDRVECYYDMPKPGHSRSSEVIVEYDDFIIVSDEGDCYYSCEDAKIFNAPVARAA